MMIAAADACGVDVDDDPVVGSRRCRDVGKLRRCGEAVVDDDAHAADDSRESPRLCAPSGRCGADRGARRSGGACTSPVGLS
ncbi:Uncharacterised protein [Mycobacteroides abscessus subsp. abscessus]|nr:Uncharacterised protein [Mycobacteroides abscessus subsp. abscessus]